jgi:hypothetical protein
LGPPSLTPLPSARIMRLTLITGRYAFPGGKGTTERIRVFEIKQVCGLIQVQDGIGEVVPNLCATCKRQVPTEHATQLLRLKLQLLSAWKHRQNGWHLELRPCCCWLALHTTVRGLGLMVLSVPATNIQLGLLLLQAGLVMTVLKLTAAFSTCDRAMNVACSSERSAAKYS